MIDDTIYNAFNRKIRQLRHEKGLPEPTCGEEYIHNSPNEKYKDFLATQFSQEIPAFFSKEQKTADIYAFMRKVLAQSQPKDGGGLVGWRKLRSLDTLIKDYTNEDSPVLADLFSNFYRNQISDRAFFDKMYSYVKSWDLLSYLMFTKNPTQYLPMKPRYMEKGFRQLRVESPRLCGRISFDNYLAYLQIMKDIQAQLAHHYNTDKVTLLDAHSFVWAVARYDLDISGN